MAASPILQQLSSAFRGAGFSRAGAAGIIGNLQQESSLNPNAPGGGLAQWIGPRQTALHSFAASQGRSPTDPTVQASFLVNELKTQYPGLSSFLQKTNDPRAAALAVSQQYERPGVPMNQNRVNYATSAFQQLGGVGSGSPAVAATAAGGTTTQFDQAAFEKAQQAAIAGKFLAQNAGGMSLFNTGPKSSVPAGASLFGPGLLTTTAPNKADYTTTVKAAQQGLQGLAGGTNLTTHPGALPAGSGDVNPLAHGWKIGRTDQGVDANAAPGTPILAVNDSVVKQIIPSWYNGQPLVLMQLTAGPNAGKYWYTSEQITGIPKVGQQIARGQIVARYANSGTGIEIGWGSPTSSGRTLAQATPGYSGDQSPAALAAGQDFRQKILGQ